MCACNANLSYKRSNSGIIKKNAIILTVSIIYLIFVAQKYNIISIKEKRFKVDHCFTIMSLDGIVYYLL